MQHQADLKLHSNKPQARLYTVAARWHRGRLWLVAMALVVAGCASAPWPPSAPTAPSQPDDAAPQGEVVEPEKAAFQAILSGAEAVPSNDSQGRGRLVAILDKKTGMFRWKMQFKGLSGPVRRAGFHSPGMSGEVAPEVLSLGSMVQNSSEGRAQLTPRQQSDLLTGQWYVNLPTERYPEGELRGQLIEQR